MNMSVNHHIPTLPRLGNPNRRALKPLRSLVKLMYGTDPHPSPGQIATVERYMQLGDPLADAVVAMYKDLPTGQGRKLLDQALENGIHTVQNPPQALVDLFLQIDQEPIWLDRGKIKLACEVSRRIGPWGELVLRNLALMAGYLGGAAAKPLVFTGQLDRMTPRRLVETGKFWMDVTTNGGLERDAGGFKSAVRVRMMHAQVRAMLLKSGKWDDAWGHPLNQWDSMATILEFSSIYLTGLRALGFVFTKKEREAITHLWRYIGYLMGVDETILPANETDSIRAMYLASATAPKPDEDSKILGQSLGDSPLMFASDHWFSQRAAKVERTLRIGYSRYLLGDNACNQLGLPDTKAKYFWPATVPLRMSSELVRKTVPGVNQLLIKWGEKATKEQFPQQVKQTQADTTFTPVKKLAR